MSVQWPKVGLGRAKWVIKNGKSCCRMYLFMFKEYSHFNSLKLLIWFISFLLLWVTFLWPESVIFKSFQFIFLITCFGYLQFTVAILLAIYFLLPFSKVCFKLSYSIHWNRFFFTPHKKCHHILVSLYILVKCSFV